MRVITLNDLAKRTDLEIAVLFHVATQAVGGTIPGTPARDAVIVSLPNIDRARGGDRKAALSAASKGLSSPIFTPTAAGSSRRSSG